MNKKRRRVSRATRKKIAAGLARYHRQRIRAAAARSRAARKGWKTRRAKQRHPPVKVPELPRVRAVEFELTRVTETRRRDKAGAPKKVIDQTLRFTPKRGATMTPQEAREILLHGERSRWGRVLDQYDVTRFDWTNEGDKVPYRYDEPRDIRDAMEASRSMRWRYGEVQPL